MKITEDQDRLIIDNSLLMPIATGVILIIVGAGFGVSGFVTRPLWLAGIGLVVVVVGALVIVFSKSSHIVLSKAGDSSITAKTLFGESNTHTFQLADIVSVNLDTSQTREVVNDNDGTQRSQTRVRSNLCLHTDDGQRIQIGSQTKTMNVGGIIGALVESVPLREEADQVATFIGVPMKVQDGIALMPNAKMRS